MAIVVEGGYAPPTGPPRGGGPWDEAPIGPEGGFSKGGSKLES